MANRIVPVSGGGSALADAVAAATNHSGDEDHLIFSVSSGTYTKPEIDSCAWATTSAHKIQLVSAASNFHNFARSTGVRIVTPDDWDAYEWTKNYIEHIGIAFTVTAEAGILAAAASWGQYALFDSCFAYDCIPGDSSEYGCGGLLCCDGGDPQYNKFINCAAVNCGGPGIGAQYNTVATDMLVYGSVALNCYIGISLASYRNTYVKNSYAGGCTDNYYQGEGGTGYLTTCASPNGDLSTATISLANCHFNNITAGSEDIRFTSASSLIGAGTDLSADALYPVSVDGWSTARAATPCIGPYEYVSSGSDSSTHMKLLMVDRKLMRIRC